MLFFFPEMVSRYVAQDGLELLSSSDPPPLASQVDGTTGIHHNIQFSYLLLKNRSPIQEAFPTYNSQKPLFCELLWYLYHLILHCYATYYFLCSGIILQMSITVPEGKVFNSCTSSGQLTQCWTIYIPANWPPSNQNLIPRSRLDPLQ